MPASVAHAYFASDVYDTLSSELKNKLSAYCELNNKNGKRRSQ